MSIARSRRHSFIMTAVRSRPPIRLAGLSHASRFRNKPWAVPSACCTAFMPAVSIVAMMEPSKGAVTDTFSPSGSAPGTKRDMCCVIG